MTAWLMAGAIGIAVVGWSRPTPRRLPEPTSPATITRPMHEVLRRAVDRAFPSLRRARRDRQLPDAIDRLASALRAGEAVGPALVGLSREIADPLGEDLREVARQIEHGASVGAALATWSAAPTSSPDVQVVSAALTIGARAGGEVARAVDGVGATLRERHELGAEVRALATQARASAAVLAVAPVFFAVLVATIEPKAIAFLLTTPAGLTCLVAGLSLDGIGAWWMARITRSAG